MLKMSTEDKTKAFDDADKTSFQIPPVEIEVRLSPAWLTFIKYCQTQVGYGTVFTKLSNGQPTIQTKAEKEIRFDREPPAQIQNASDVRAPLSWIRFVRFCQLEIPFGTVGVRLVAGQPTILLKSKREVRFDKMETIPEIFDATSSFNGRD